MEHRNESIFFFSLPDLSAAMASVVKHEERQAMAAARFIYIYDIKSKTVAIIVTA